MACALRFSCRAVSLYCLNRIMKNLTAPLPPLRASKLLDPLREHIRYLHDSLRAVEAYVYWVRGYRYRPGWAYRGS